MKTIPQQTTVLSAHITHPASKAEFAPHQPYSAGAMKTMRELVKTVQDARTGQPPVPSYTPPRWNYDGAELKPYAGRPGATDTQCLPSRVNNRLRYPDGRVTDLAGNPLQEVWSKA